MPRPKPTHRLSPTRARVSARPLARRPAPAEPPSFVVGVGASAGGLQALQAFFEALPQQVPAAFVVVQHLSPDFKSFMVELLAKHTALHVQRAEQGARVEPGHVYLIPPKVTLTIREGRLNLEDSDPRDGLHLPIDAFFLSLAHDQQQRAVAIVLSGTGSDGTAGIRAVKDAGGAVMVQSEDSAQFDGMPRSAIATGLADYVLPPDKMAAQLVAYLKHPATSRSRALAATAAGPALNQIVGVLRGQCGVDFTHYKSATIERRIERRMSVCQIPSLPDYVRHVAQSPREASLLFNELLINVTAFFRDKQCWDLLTRSVVPTLLKQLPPSEPFRAWVAGCSTGEEAYSLAMIVAEQMEKLRLYRPVKIFATDIAKDALTTAARGLYSPSEIAGISPARLQQFFVKESAGYRVRARVREMVVFANHNVLSDPPFTKLSLLSCRNLLIYLQSPMQQRLLSLFSFALRDEGVLFLGGSETIGDATDRFHPIATRANLYRNRRASQPPPPLSNPERTPRPATESSAVRRAAARITAGDVPSIEEINARIVQEFAPACLVVDSRDDILQILGNAGDYLKHPPGGFTRNIFKLTSHNFANALRSALIRAQQRKDRFTLENVRFRVGRKTQIVRLHIRPLSDDQDKPTGTRLVLIEPLASAAPGPTRGRTRRDDPRMSERIGDLERDLSLTRESLQATVQDLETSNEEIQAANEELLAANEELQSTNEELQSVNEELHTVNAENQNRIEELTRLTNDINNLLATAAVGVLLVDSQLRIRRASRSALAALDLTESDVGTPIETVARILRAPTLPAVAERVMRTGQPEEQELERAGHRWVLLRCVPFRNELGETSGVVLTLIDLTERHEAAKQLLEQAAITQTVLDTIDANVAVVDREGRIQYVNNAWGRLGIHGPAPAPANLGVGTNYFEACDASARAGQVAASAALAGMKKVLRGELSRFSHDYALEGPSGPIWFRMNVVPLDPAESGLAVTHFPISAADLTPLARS